MLVQVVGCSHHGTSIALRERLAFTAEQAREALDRWRRVFPRVESVLLSTCNRVELYSATDQENEPTFEQVAAYLARFHGLEPEEVAQHLYRHSDEAAVRHLFAVTSSLDSMVLGEPQIFAQVKEAYQLATQQDNTGPLMHAIFQTALRVARRVASETAIHQRRVSVPSVAVADFARQVFERFDDKEVLVIGAGEMAQETLQYLEDEGARRITVVNRHFPRAVELADRWKGRAVAWDELPAALAAADVVVSIAAAGHWIVGREQFAQIEALRFARPLFILDLAVPAISIRPSATGPTSICIPSTISRRRASATACIATRSCRPPCTSSIRKRPVSWPSCTTAPSARSSSSFDSAGSCRKRKNCSGS